MYCITTYIVHIYELGEFQYCVKHARVAFKVTIAIVTFIQFFDAIFIRLQNILYIFIFSNKNQCRTWKIVFNAD